MGTVLAVALAARVVLLARSSWLLEGDDALSALMALAILEGDRPIMLTNQTYAAAWEPYAIAASFGLFGVSRWAAKLPALLTSMALLASTWWLARQAAGPVAARLAVFLVAVPPVYVLVLSLKPWAPYSEVILLGSIALGCAIRAASPNGGARLRWAGACGIFGGLAFWMHPLAVFYLVPSGLVLLVGSASRPAEGDHRSHVGAVAKQLVSSGSAALAGFAVGALPVWLYNLQTGGATVRFVLAGTAGQSADRAAVLQAWWTNDLPRALGLWDPWSPAPGMLAWPLAAIYALSLATAFLAARQATTNVMEHQPTLRLRPLDALLVLLATIPTLLVLSGFGGTALNPWGFDATGRYAPPIWYAIAIVLGWCAALLWHRRAALATAMVALVLSANLYGWATLDASRAFQSPYWDKLPLDSSPLLDQLRARGVTHVWLNHWAGLPLMLDARARGQTLVAYDWYDVQAGGIDRFPEYLGLVEQADQPAFILVTDEPEPELARRLRGLAVAYTLDRLPPYALLIPTSRKVHPSEVTDALDYRY